MELLRFSIVYLDNNGDKRMLSTAGFTSPVGRTSRDDARPIPGSADIFAPEKSNQPNKMVNTGKASPEERRAVMDMLEQFLFGKGGRV